MSDDNDDYESATASLQSTAVEARRVRQSARQGEGSQGLKTDLEAELNATATVTGRMAGARRDVSSAVMATFAAAQQTETSRPRRS